MFVKFDNIGIDSTHSGAVWVFYNPLGLKVLVNILDLNLRTRESEQIKAKWLNRVRKLFSM